MKLTVAVVAAVALVVAAALVFRGRDVDRDEYVRANVAVLDDFPVYPGARAVETQSSPCKESEQDFARTVAYYTSRRYVLDEPARPQRVVAFLRRQARGWRVVDASPAPSVSLRRGTAYVHVLAGDDEYSVSVDHDFRACPGA